MDEATTRHLNAFEQRMIAAIAEMRAEMRGEFADTRRQLATLDARLTTLEEQAAARARETRPLWEAVLARLEQIDERLELMDAKQGRLAADWLTLRADLDVLKRKLFPPAA